MSSILQASCLLAILAAGEPAKRPEVGAAAPTFSVAATTGKSITLAEFKGKRQVVLAFFPKAFTGG
jgi:peroxiredoxin Q/BCP